MVYSSPPEVVSVVDSAGAGSSGLAAEVNHICDQSGTGAEIMLADIPIHPSVIDAAQATGKDPYEFALSGGEDFELLFSISPQNKRKLDEKGVSLTTVGVVTEAASPGRGIQPFRGLQRFG